jgi:hypothetical protein
MSRNTKKSEFGLPEGEYPVSQSPGFFSVSKAPTLTTTELAKSAAADAIAFMKVRKAEVESAKSLQGTCANPSTF